MISPASLPGELFTEHAIAPGFRLFTFATPQFKNTTVSLFWHNALNEDASKLAVIGPVLKRGCQPHPDLTSIAVFLEDLYGASFDTDVHKIGEHHILEFRLSLLNDKYAFRGEPLLEQGLRFLRAIVAEPVTDDGAFAAGIFTVEQENLLRFLGALYDDKDAWAREQCTKLMFGAEAYARNEHGDAVTVATLDAEDTFRFYRERLASSPLDLYILGDIDPAAVAELARRCFPLPRAASISPIAPDAPHAAPDAPRVHFETQPLEQGKLVMGLASPVTVRQGDHYAMTLAASVLGGYPHSKLFTQVREKQSLCYTIYASYNRYKGHLNIRAGVSAGNYEKAVAAIDGQIDAMRQGDITAREIEETQKAILSGLASSLDSPHAVITRALTESHAGKPASYRDAAEALLAVTRDRIIAAARQWRPDTTYFLSNRESSPST